MKHFGMSLEFLLRRKPRWVQTLKPSLFAEGAIVRDVEVGDETT
jgi:hypothetical protein